MDNVYFEVENLYFSYYKQPLSLMDINFSVNKGEKVLILASKDMGKTTVLSVLSSFQNNYFGKINLNGKELKDIDDSEKNFSLLPSNPVFFDNKSILDNINYFCKVNSMPYFSEGKLKEKLKEINIIEDVKKKLSKLDIYTKIKLAIFRSLLKNPSIIFLDNQFENIKNDSEISELKRVYEVLIKHNNTIFFAFDDLFFKENLEFIKSLKIDKILYLNYAKVKEFLKVNDFLSNITNLNQLLFIDNFCNNNSYNGYILFDNENYYYNDDNNFILKIDEKYYEKLSRLNLKNGDSEDIVIYINKDINLSSIDDVTFNSLLDDGNIFIFSSIDGEKLIG